MPQPAIEVQGVFKKFRRGEHFDSLRDLLAARVFRRRGREERQSAEFWALHDVSLQLEAGEACGVIGPNGAGKSTLLKILAGIMRPNRGRVDIRGRVSALIELGAGFHGDLTGRENIYLNASILGMPRTEVRHRFDEIVEFAGICDFLDTPIKRYSSGMHARLGFAIAVHADPQVLLVDEVLSVGDRVFRSKCMEKMQAFLKQGVAVVFVSHDLSAVSRFCDRAMVLDRGHVIFAGASGDAIGHYYGACTPYSPDRGATEDPLVRVSDICLRDRFGREVSTVAPGDIVRFEYDVSFDVDVSRPSYGLALVRVEDHLTLFETSSTRLGVESPPVHRGGRHHVSYEFQVNLPPGEYSVGLHVRERDAMCYAVEDAHAGRIMVVGPKNSGGVVHVDPQVQVEKLSGRAMAPPVLTVSR